MCPTCGHAAKHIQYASVGKATFCGECYGQVCHRPTDNGELFTWHCTKGHEEVTWQDYWAYNPKCWFCGEPVMTLEQVEAGQW